MKGLMPKCPQCKLWGGTLKQAYTIYTYQLRGPCGPDLCGVVRFYLSCSLSLQNEYGNNNNVLIM